MSEAASLGRGTDIGQEILGWFQAFAAVLFGEERALGQAGHSEEVARFHALVERHRGPLQRLCDFRERDPEARKDLWQEIALALWKSRGSFREQSAERTWVLRIAHNVAATHAARAVRIKPEVRDDDRAEQEAVSPSGEDRVALAELRAKLATLDLLSQELVLLHLEGLSATEIADVTGLTLTNVTTRVSRIRKKLSDSREGT